MLPYLLFQASVALSMHIMEQNIIEKAKTHCY